MANSNLSRLGAFSALVALLVSSPALFSASPTLFSTSPALFAPSRAQAQLMPPDPVNEYLRAPAAQGAPAGQIPSGMVEVGHDEARHVPTLIVGRRRVRPAGRTPEQIAASHLLALAPNYGLGSAALSTVETQQIRPTPAGGHVVVFRQRVNGVEVFDARLTLLLDRHGALIAAGGELFGAAASYDFPRDEVASAEVALADMFRANAPGAATVATAGVDANGHARLTVNRVGRSLGYRLDQPIRAYRVLFPMPERLVPAHYLELWTSGTHGGGPLYGYVVSAEDGSVLLRRLLTDSEFYRFRVYSDPTAPFEPVDSPFGDTTPDAAGMVVAGVPPYVSQSDVRIEGLNTNPATMSDPWLPNAAMVTRGNNVDAYADLVSPDGFGAGDERAARTAPGEFLYTHDPLVDPGSNPTQRQAAVTHLFFMNNWLHDYFYDNGFDEAAGNAQTDNFGRGGEGSDSLRAEAMDSSGRNNANMSTPRDGSRPRMQMYLWDGFSQAFVESGGASFSVGTASFGTQDFDLTANTRLAVDGTSPSNDACQSVTNNLTGQIALVDRGGCSFSLKAANARDAGAVGVIILNNRSPGTSGMSGTLSGMAVPVLMVSQEDGATLRSTAGSAARMFRTSRPDAPSSFDSQVVAHEWGHYMHRRLVSFGSVQGRSMSEGWGDYIGVFTGLHASDDLTGAFPAAAWSAQARDPVYFGIRRVPYSQNRALNDLTFRHISRGEPLPTTAPLGRGPADNAEVHNAGEIWATMMFDALLKMLEWSFSPASGYSFAEARQRMSHYVITGMQLAPREPTFTEQRDAIIAAAMETDMDDARRIALAFAGRGAGSCAVSPPRDSTDLVGVVEDYAIAASPSIANVAVEALGPGRQCDSDTVLDAGEDGWVRVEIQNDGVANMAGASLTVSADDAAVTFPAGETQAVPPLGPGARAEVWVPTRVADAATVAGPVTFTTTIRGPGLCDDVTAELRAPIDRDATLLDTETFEITPPWFRETSIDGMTTGVWAVTSSVLGDPDRVLRGTGVVGVTDTAVELPEVAASTTDPLILSFAHRFEFEADATTWWDGGVIELSTNGGMSWRDVSDFVDPGYTGALTDRAGNPLSLRDAYSGENPSAPNADNVVLDFGSALAGQAVRFRFRIGTDPATGTPGWEIDDVRIQGGAPLPFPGFVPDAGDCADAPIADAGPDQTVEELSVVSLDASGSSDPNMDPLTFAWESVGEDLGLTLSDPAIATPTFTAPDVDEVTVVTLRVRVSDGTGSSTDDVDITITPVAPPMVDAGPPPMPGTDAGPPSMPGTDAGPVRPRTDGGVADVDAGPEAMDDGGCSCRAAAPSRGRAPFAIGLGLLGVGLLARRRRR